MDTPLDTELAAYLQDLSAVQDKTLDVLVRKRQMLMEADTEGWPPWERKRPGWWRASRSVLIGGRNCSTGAATKGSPRTASARYAPTAGPAQQRPLLPDSPSFSPCRLLQHHSLTNWVLVQKTLIHLSQLLEIIATGGRLQPTYSRDEAVRPPGALVDREV